MPWTNRQFRFLLSKVSPLSEHKKTEMKEEAHEDPAMIHKRKGYHKSMQQGGTADRTADYRLHQGEEVIPPIQPIRTAPVALYEPTYRAPIEPLSRYQAPRIPAGPTPGYHQTKLPPGSTGLMSRPPGMKHGGTVHHTGIYRLHKGERVIPSRMAAHFKGRRR